MLDYIKLNVKEIYKYATKAAGVLFGVLTLSLTFFSWESLRITSVIYRLVIFVAVLVASIIYALLTVLLKHKNVIWHRGTGKIQVLYGDIFKDAFPKKHKKSKIIVIPVNTSFDSLVGSGIVSERSIHGQWIRQMEKHGLYQDALDREIEQALIQQNIHATKEIALKDRPRGKRKIYPRGTVLQIDWKNGVRFFLLALSEFDENLNAQCSRKEYMQCIEELIKFYDREGQGDSLYLPLMGTGLSRVNIEEQVALSIIVNMFRLNQDRIHGEVNIVVFNKTKNHVSMFDL